MAVTTLVFGRHCLDSSSPLRPNGMPTSSNSSNALLRAYVDERIVSGLQQRVLNIATTTVAILSALLSLLLLFPALGYLEFPALYMVTTATQVKAVISLAHSLGMKVTDEGVETIEQRDILVGIGCDYGQGWLFGCSLRAEAFEAALSKQQQG